MMQQGPNPLISAGDIALVRPIGLYDEATALKQLKEGQPSLLEADPAELALIQLLRGETVSGKVGGRFVVFYEHTSGESVLFLYDPAKPLDSSLNSKYIIAEPVTAHDGGKSFIVAMPMEWTPMHRDILLRISAATGQQYRCPGGGMVEFVGEGAHIGLKVSGASGDFGAGDHDRAQAAFRRAIERTPLREEVLPDSN